MMESQHGGHYTVYNLSERSYPAARFPSGQVVHSPLRQDAAPSLDVLLDLCSGILDYLSRKKATLSCKNTSHKSSVVDPDLFRIRRQIFRNTVRIWILPML